MSTLSDTYLVDRSHLADRRMPDLDPDIAIIEARLSEIRRRATYQEQLDAWRALTGVTSRAPKGAAA